MSIETSLIELDILRRLEKLGLQLEQYSKDSQTPAKEESFQQTIFKNFCRECFVYDSEYSSTIDQERDFLLIDELFVTYVHYMLDKNEKDKLIDDLKKRDDLPPPAVPKPYGSKILPNRAKTLVHAKISPFILKMNELRKIEDRTIENQNDLLK